MDLGVKHQVTAYFVRGADPAKLQDLRTMNLFMKNLVEAIKMEPNGGAVICPYPTKNNQGGVGFTIFQPIVTSYIGFDTWPEIEGGAILMICTCREALVKTAKSLLLQTFGGTAETVDVKADLTKPGVKIWHESS